MLALFRIPAFLHFWLAQVFSRLGDAIATTAIIFLIGSNSSDPIFISLVIFAELFATTAFGLFAGSIADRFPKHLVMIYMDIFRVLINIVIILCISSPIALIVLVFLKGIGTTVFYPARTSFIPDIVGDKHVNEAMSISQSTYFTVYIIGPAIAGFLLTTTSVPIIFIIDILSYVLSIIFILIANSFVVSTAVLEPKEATKVTHEPIWASMIAGLKTVYNIPSLFFLLMILIPFMFVAGIFDTTYTSILLQVFRLPAIDYGQIQSIEGIGAVVGAIVGPFLLRKLNSSLLLVCTIIAFGILMSCVTPLNYIHTSNLSPIYVWSLAIGSINALINLPITSIFLKITPRPFRGRGISILQTLTTLGIVLGLLSGGIVARYFNLITLTTFAGIALIIFILIIACTSKFKHLFQESRPEPKLKSSSSQATKSL